MNIKKVDDKPMVIHTKKKTKLHMHEPKKAEIKAANTYTVSRGPDVGKTLIGKSRSSTVHKVETVKKGMFNQYRTALNESKKSIKTKTSSIKVAGAVGAQTALSQVEGGDEIRDATMIAHVATRPAANASSRGVELFKRQAVEQAKKRIKKVNSAKKIGKKAAKDTTKKAAKGTAKKVAKETTKETAKVAAKLATDASVAVAGTVAGAESGPAAPLIGIAAGLAAGEIIGTKMNIADAKANSRNRKIKFFLDKMKAEDKQQDSVAKLIKDLVLNKMALPTKKIAVVAGAFLLVMVLLITVTILPVVGIISILYNSPFAFFLPPLEDGETVTTVCSAYVQEFNRDVQSEVDSHPNCDVGQIVYVDFEGESPSNYNDIVAVYMVKYGVEDTATIMNDTSKDRLKGVVDDMCSYTTSTGSETIENEDGTTTTQSVYYVNVKLKTYEDMITEYSFDTDRTELVEQMMQMFGNASGVTPQSTLSQAYIDEFVRDITDPKQKAAVTFALTRVGYPYSQAQRHSGNAYDCSSLVYYAWLDAGVDISYEGASTASWEAKGLDLAGKGVNYEDIQPGDLIFYSYENNGCYLNISHVGMYVGNGMFVDARGTAYGVVFREVPTSNIVFIGRPQ